jgi:predicted nucleotidyltransferase
MAKEQIVDIARQYLVLLRKEGLDVDRIYLFGSYSDDRETKDSDIDIMVVSRSDKNDDTSPIIQMVKREGIEIAS